MSDCYNKYCSICGKEKEASFISIINRDIYKPCICEIKKEEEEKKLLITQNRRKIFETLKEKCNIQGIENGYYFNNFKAYNESLSKAKQICESFSENIGGNLFKRRSRYG